MRKLLPFISISYSIVLTVLSLIKSPAPKDLPTNSDKVFHAIAYCIFALVWFFTLHYTFNKVKNKAILIAVIAAIVFGIVIEILQQVLTTDRQGDLNDVIANTLGALVAVLIIKLLKIRNVKN